MEEKRRKSRQKGLLTLIGRNDYLVTEANDLAKALGKLSKAELKLLSYLVSFIQKEHTGSEVYEEKFSNVLKVLNLTDGGANYVTLAKSLDRLEDHSKVWVELEGTNGDKIQKARIIKDLTFDRKNLSFSWKFDNAIRPFLFQLTGEGKGNYFSLPLYMICQFNSEYAIYMLYMWAAASYGTGLRTTEITEDYETWIKAFGLAEKTNLTPGKFKDRYLRKALQTVTDAQGYNFSITTLKNGVKTVGYTVNIFKSKDKEK